MRILLALSVLFALGGSSSVWTVNCAPLTIQRSDPIQYPGIAATHVHAVVGSTAFQRSMEVNTARNGRATTCDKTTDHSNYWAPQLYSVSADGAFRAMPFTGMAAYYTNYTCDHSSSGHCPQEGRNPRAFPAGLRMVAGNSTRRSLDKSDLWQTAILMESGNDGEVYGMPNRLNGRISGHVRFPSCWNGVHLDSADHQSHVSYPDPELGGDTQGGMCPESHPYAMFNIGAEFGWDTEGLEDGDRLVWSQGDTTGYGFHAAFLMGWQDRGALQQSFDTCFDNGNCPWRNFGTVNGQPGTMQAMGPEVAAPDENIGLTGPISVLPGHNKLSRLKR